jgi:hypothetical protein
MTEPVVRKPVALRTLHGIEMAAVGTWKASTGETTFTVEDFTDAVAALECPGVRNPVIKLGHAEPDSDSGIRWDGEPALGWVANMRFDGAKLLGDFTGMPAWLVDADENGLSVMAAAYPDRSIEIWRPFVCQIGHLHPSVVTAISLLGVAPPGVGVLKSMQDVYAAYTTDPGAPIQAAAGQSFTLMTTITLAAAEQRQPTDIEQRSGIDFAAEREQWDSALGDLLDDWPDISEAQRTELSAQIADAVDNDPDALGRLTVDSATAAAALLAAMKKLGLKAAAQQVAAAGKQGATVALPEITDDMMQPVAEGVASSMAASTASMAGRTAAQALGTGKGTDIADLVMNELAGLTDRFWRDQLGGALSAAQHRGRIAVLAGWDGDVELYASEINDTNACAPCRSIDGAKFDSVDEADSAYGGGKYVGCSGGARCRGQLIAIFGSDQTSASATVRTTVRTHLGGVMPTVVKASVSVEDISRKYYESAGYSMWITEMQVDPLQLIAADDATGKYYRIPVELSGETFTFGEPQEVAVAYQDVKTAAKSGARFDSRKVSLLAAGKKEDGSDLVAPDVSPAGAAIRKAAQKLEAAPGVIETEVIAPEETTKTPDADPATGPTTTPKEASVDAAKMREALGLKPDATDEELRAAFAAQASAPAPTPTEEPDPLAALTAKLPVGEKPILVDPENYKSLVTMAAKGELAFAKTVKAEGKEFLESAAREGRFPVARLSVYQEMWDMDPEKTRAYVALMPKNTVPTMAAGVMGQEISQNESDAAYAAYMNEAGN